MAERNLDSPTGERLDRLFRTVLPKGWGWSVKDGNIVIGDRRGYVRLDTPYVDVAESFVQGISQGMKESSDGNSTSD